MTYRSKTKPRAAQKKEFELHRDKDRRALLWRMRSGKSKAIIDLAEYVFHEKGITGVVILAPNGVHDNWVRREFPKHCSTPYRAAAYRSTARSTQWHAKAMHRLMHRDKRTMAFLTINSEAVWREPVKKLMGQFLKSHKGKIMLVVDESHDFRTPGSRRSRVARGFAKQCKYVRIMTGTPVENSPLHAWSQFEILKKGALGFERYGDFKDRYAVTRKAYGSGGREFEQIVGYQHQEELRAKIAEWSSVVLKKDAGVSEWEHSTIAFRMTEKQRKVYARLVKDCLLEENAYEGGAKMTKLQQITRGWYYDDDGQAQEIIPRKKNEALRRLVDAIEGVEGKIIVWAAFTEEINAISKTLQEAGIRATMYRGGMTAAAKNKAIEQFVMNPTVKVIVGQPKSAMSKGFDFSVADTIIWYSHVHDMIDYEQASDRGSSVDKATVDIVSLECVDSVDSYVISSQRNKRSIADDLAGDGLRHILLLEELA